MTWETDDTITAEKLPAGCIAVDSSLSVPTGSNTLASLTGDYDPGSWVSGGKIVMPTAGLYIATMSVDWTTGLGTSTRIIGVLTAYTPSEVIAQEDRISGSTDSNMSISGMIHAAADQEISGFVWQSSGSTKSCALRIAVARIAPA
jgi:hypothetical protein